MKLVHIFLCLTLVTKHAYAATRQYYIAAEMVEWDYGPTGIDQITGMGFDGMMMNPQNCTNSSMGGGMGGMGGMKLLQMDSMDNCSDSSMNMTGGDMGGMSDMSNVTHMDGMGGHGHSMHSSGTWMSPTELSRIGRIYTKAQYIEYTDDTFLYKKERPKEENHLGILGPVIRASVGDTIKISFLNLLDFPSSMHPHGVWYDKMNEGAVYKDGEPDMGDSVHSQCSYDYTWEVPERAGPGPGDPSSILWMYHSHVDETADVPAGLVGPIIITGAKNSDPDTAKPTDVDRELFTAFIIFDESASPMFNMNVQKMNMSGNLTSEMVDMLMMMDDFKSTNEMHSINGFMYGNAPDMDMYENERVRWYVFGTGNEDGIHTPHWHGQTMVNLGHRTDSINILPASMVTMDSIADNIGTWILHCHVDHHIHAGMTALFNVIESMNDVRCCNDASMSCMMYMNCMTASDELMDGTCDNSPTATSCWSLAGQSGIGDDFEAFEVLFNCVANCNDEEEVKDWEVADVELHGQLQDQIVAVEVQVSANAEDSAAEIQELREALDTAIETSTAANTAFEETIAELRSEIDGVRNMKCEECEAAKNRNSDVTSGTGAYGTLAFSKIGILSVCMLFIFIQ